MKIKFFIIIGLIFNLGFSQLSTDKNFVHVKTYRNAVNENTSSSNEDDFNEVVSYLDGSGRQDQSILIKAGGQGEDIIFNKEYDALKREPKIYLPYAKGNNDGTYETNFSGLQLSFYNTAKYEYTLNPYQEKVYDDTDLGFVNEVSTPGNDWDLSGGKTQKQKYQLYNYQGIDDNVYRYTVDLSTPGLPILLYSGDIYAPVTLMKYIVKNENWVSSDNKDNTTEIFKDQKGRVVLKRMFENNVAHDTYYVYDVQGNLTFMIPPVVNHNDLFDSYNNPTTDHNLILAKYCFQYKYDFKNRLIEKKIPGKGWEYFVYDKLNRAVLSQDATQRTIGANNWSFIEYDIYGRIVYEGILTDSNNYTREQIQVVLDGLDTKVYYNGLPPFNYSHYLDQFTLDVNSVNYYDNYQFDLDGISIPSLNLYNIEVSQYTESLLTGTKVRTLGTNEWETSVYLYDEKDRGIKIISNNQTLESSSSVDYKLSFSGNVLESKSIHSKTGVVTDLETIDEYFYDRNDRLIQHNQSINDKSKELIAAYNYDELGKLVEKKVGGSTYLQLTGLTDNQGEIIKDSGVTSWTDNSLESTTSIIENGKLSFKASVNLSYLALGLSYTPSSTNQSQIPYTFLLMSNDHPSGGKWLYLYEEGVNKLGTNFFPDDELSIERIDNQVVYKKNNVVIYTSSTIASNLPLFADGHFLTVQSSVTNLSIENYSYENITALQTIDYKYSIKGELTKINDVNALGNDLFALEIRRNNPTVTGTPLYNGNVSQVFWKTANDNQLRYYDYSYDKLHRIKKAQFYNVDNALQDNSFNLETVNYDKNGNITFLHRAGDKMNQANLEWMDYMTYEYDGNQLTRVLEQGHNYQGHATQVLQTDTTPQYEYDANGNLMKDRNKEIENITYNHLDLPETITFEGTVTKTIQYIYDASGKKIQKIVNNDGNITITEYGNGYIYKTVNSNPTTLEYIQQAEGYIAHNNGSYNYVYNHTDHLGNIRLTYTDSNNDGAVTTAEIIEENNYFPFGMKHQGYNNLYNPIGSVSYKFGFEGQEHQDDFGLNWIQFKWRNEDPALGRFFSIDPLAEKYDHLTPYQFSSNQPIHAIEVEGLESDDDLNYDDYNYGGGYVGPGWDGCIGPADGTMLNGYVGYGQYGGSGIGDEYGDDLVGDVDAEENENDDYTWGDFKYDYLKFANRADRIAENFGKEFGKAIVSFHPGIGLWNAYEGFTKGKDLYGEELGKGGATFEAVMAVIPVVKGVKILSLGDDVVRAAKGGTSLWTSTSKLSSVKNAFGHWKKHGAEFPEFLNAKQYVEGAKNFMHNSPAGTLMKARANGDILKYHPGTNTFGVMDASGVPRTMFRPTDGMKYWLGQ